MTKVIEQASAPVTSGIILHSAGLYDFLASVMMLGRERSFREKVIDLARIKAGESVLDVGCGTGTLAIAAKRRVGPNGKVYGIDASPEMIARANKKARKAGAEVVFKNDVVEALPFTDQSFDVILSTLMLHHLPPETRKECAREMRRVLKPGGRILAIDFATSGKKKGLLAHLHRRHGSVKLGEIIDVLSQAGLTIVESGELGMKDMHFVLATAA